MPKTFPIYFGKNSEYELTERALKHILEGDMTVRPLRVEGVSSKETVLSGGLHTWEGWDSFRSQHTKIAHLLEYDVARHDDWYFARELQNGVITLKVPRKMFTGDAAKITMQPDNYYKSGYLWKTLYPVGYSEEDILKVISEAFSNIDEEDSSYPKDEQSSGVLYGYALLDDPFKSLKLRIQLRGTQIQSAFPAWEQPLTGNNGKAYSHSNSINFNVSQSTLFFERFSKGWGLAFKENGFCVDSFLSATPDFILRRPRRDSTVTIAKWRDMREKELISIAPLMTPEELQKIETYLNDYVCCKDPYGTQMGFYTNLFNYVCHSDQIFNAAQLFENIAECIQILTHSDIENGTRRAMDAMIKFLRMAVVHTSGLCTLVFKRVLGEFLEAALGHPDVNSHHDFFEALASSPSRAALYSEFDLTPFVKENNEAGWVTLGLSEVDIELRPEHFYEFLSLNLGENYLLVLSKEERLAVARGCFSQLELQVMVSDTMTFLSGIDFQFFMPFRLSPSWLERKLPPKEEDLISVVRDYSRMLVMYRQRVVLEDPKAYKAEIDPEQAGTPEFFNLILQKHKRSFILNVHQEMLEKLSDLASTLGYQRLKDKVETILNNLPKEAIPLPKPIPDYILERRGIKRESKRSEDVDSLVKLVLGDEP